VPTSRKLEGLGVSAAGTGVPVTDEVKLIISGMAGKETPGT
jgi:hypothetical protein